MLRRITFAVAGFTLLGTTLHAGSADETDGPKIRVPPGFVVEKVAGLPLVEHPMMGCFDERGRLFLAESSGKNLRKPDLLKAPPNFIRVLEPAGVNGHFRKGHIFADKMTFPMGVLWHDGALYSASPPSLWKLQDTNGDGKADKRQELVTQFGFTGNAADIHGPVLGPDGWLYWCDGRHGHEIQQPDGKLMKGKAARIFRCKPDGSHVEVVCGGGMDNPVKATFTPEGEPFVTVDLFQARPARRDAIIFAIEGGVFPWNAVWKEFQRTGDLLPPVADLGWVAPAGLTRYRSDAFGKAYQGNLFTAQFNRHRVQRHIVERVGGTFQMKTEDFLVSDDKNFHPTDVLEDADGSLLVIDTGGWFRIGCPTSKIAKPEIKGGIYRVRRVDHNSPDDPRGLKNDWENATPRELAKYLGDPRFMVRDRAVHLLAKKGNAAVGALRKALESSSTPLAAKRNAVWSLTRNATPQAAKTIRETLTAQPFTVQMAAIHGLGLLRDAKSFDVLIPFLKSKNQAIIRQTATALGRLGNSKAVPALYDAIERAGDRFVEHAILYALIRIADRDQTAKYLKHESPVRKRAALIALDQMENGNLTKEELIPLLEASDAKLRQTALNVLTEHPEWSAAAASLVEQWLAKWEPKRKENLLPVLTAMSRNKTVQQVIAQSFLKNGAPLDKRLSLLEVMGATAVAKLPPAWRKALQHALEDEDARIVKQTVAAIRSAGLSEFDDRLMQLGKNDSRPDELRLAALGVVAPRAKSIDAGLFRFLTKTLRDDSSMKRRAAADVLGAAHLSTAQLRELATMVGNAGPLELRPLLRSFSQTKNEQIGQELVAALKNSSGLVTLTPGELDRVLKSFPESVREKASPLYKKLFNRNRERQKKLTSLKPLLNGGDAKLGRSLFFGRKAACAVCHAVKGDGGSIGPDLTKIGAIRSGDDLLESLVVPSSSFARGYESFVIATKTGRVLNGMLSRETADAIHLIDTNRQEFRILRQDVEHMYPAATSIMPEGLDEQLNRDELRDLLAFLQSLK